MKTIITFLLFSIALQAQEHNIWYFGNGAGLDFNNGAPVALIDGQLNTSEGTASITDSNGNLLFYTNGVTIWNKNHQIMENGLGLMGHFSAAQSALIVPKPGSQQIYYVFTVTAWGDVNGFRYSIVDMAAATGLGAVTDKNILLQTPVAEALNATWHSNGEDIWVVVHAFNSNVFSSYLVTSSGVSLNPVTSTSVLMPDSFGQSIIKISPNGSKLAFTRLNGLNGLQVFDFNNSTGSISNPVQLTGSGSYGIEFSESGHLLYMTTVNNLRQYDLLASDVSASAITIGTDPDIRLSQLQRGPDNKIYIARYLQNYVSVINDPNVLGTACNFEQFGVDLGANGLMPCISTNGLPNTVLTPILKINVNNQRICIGEEALFSMNPSTSQFDSILWEFGDGGSATEADPTHVFQQAGTYHITLTTYKQEVIRTTQAIIVVSAIPQITQPEDLTLCDDNGNGSVLFILDDQNDIILGAQNPNAYFITYHLTPQDAESGLYNLPTEFNNSITPQTIYVRMEDVASGCYAITSFRLIVMPKPTIEMADNYAFCEGNTIRLEAPEGFDSYSWSTGESERAIIVNKPGIYTLKVAITLNGNRCENSKTITIYKSEPPTITRIDTADWTTSQNSITVWVSGNGNYEYSIDDSSYQDSPQFGGLGNGIYTLYVRDKNGCGSSSEEIILLMYPKFFTPNGDGINDYWRIENSWNEPNFSVYIYDRYGKHITFFKGNTAGWDGKFNGHALPATDYWFVVHRNDGRQHKGHFSLIR